MSAAGTELPRPNPYPPGTLHDAYERCLQLELNFFGAQDSGSDVAAPLLSARVLGYLLQEISNNTGQDSLANEIVGCSDDEALRWVAHIYIDCFILACESPFSFHDDLMMAECILFLPVKRGYNSRTTPAPSEHPSRESFDDQREFYSNILEEARLDHHTAKKWVHILVPVPVIALTDFGL